MLLKKQTVWLLTMVALVLILSVYYITSDGGTRNDLAFINQEMVEEEQSGTVVEISEQGSMSGMVEGLEEDSLTLSSDDWIIAKRMQLQDIRSKEMEKLQDIAASKTATIDEINEAASKLEELETLSAKEDTLEVLIESMGYVAALVETNGNNVEVTVQAEALSPSEANAIIKKVNEEFQERKDVLVKHNP
ncbi:SpoIIIAH-like family protein [Cytobacillus sp. IB215665]|uniref:SpoIIIAH-like family protein n=1 Tax=Cytobacillus sp. IB215665 TaxID=3097357 RepID=UPI002A160261|nr:SpoIIIAH-like family protein [Cytobacillus sp. IB215665]MDX8364283.1 SpoIIIAH-like family protein [Cytobacillus sp. IB215665]